MADVSEKHSEAGLMLWIECLRDGTPDAGNIIAGALANAEREGMKRAAEIARDEAERSKNSIILPVVANMIAERILIEAGED